MTHQCFNKTQRVLTVLLAVLLGTTLMTASFATQALAQDEEEFLLEDMVITGSRILRNNMDSTSPIVTVDEMLFDHSATMAIESQLNKLPQFTPTLDIPQSGGDIQPNPQNTPGQASVSLRGIGQNRSLALINGRRGTPSNAMMVLDINTLPVAAIEYVEAITGGASSVYGADAMAGVVNFIMKDDFEGLEIDVQAGITEEGDNFEYQVSGIMGTNFANDRGNVSIAFAYNERDEALQRDRDWYRDVWADPSFGGGGFFSEFSGFNTHVFNHPDVDVVNSVIDGADFESIPFFMVIYDDGHGNAFTGFQGDLNAVPGVSGADIADGYRYKLNDLGYYSANFVDAYAILPLERWNMYSAGNYEINDYIGVFAQGYFSKVQTTTVQEAAPIIFGWSFDIQEPAIHQNSIPEEIWTILQSREFAPGVSGADAPFNLFGFLPFNRGTDTEVFTYNMMAGLEGSIPGLDDWTWEAFVSRGEAETTALNKGVTSLQRVEAIMNAGPDFGKGVSIRGNPAWGGFGAATGTCTSGLNPFDWDSVTDDCWQAVKGELKTKQVMEQTIWEANAQGAVIELPAGEMRGALGLSTRENRYRYVNDTLTSEGSSFMEQALGIYPSGDSEGKITVDEFYAELLVPVLSDLPGVKQLNLELGGRYSDYNTTGGSETYKILADWRANEWLRFRGGYNRAIRAPNIGELYMADLQDFGGVAAGDVCSTGNGQAWSADQTANPEHWADVVTLCGQLMEDVIETADDQFYGMDYRLVAAGEPVAPGEAGAAPGGPSTAFPFLIGNPDLIPETGDTWTFGVVMDSVFSDPWISDMRVTIDYYSIEVSDAIGEQSPDIVMRQCTDPSFNPTFDPNTQFCQNFNRLAVGGMGDIRRTFVNNGRFETSGIDFTINWGMDAGPGRVGVNTLINYLLDKKSAELPVFPLVDYAGTLGPEQNGLNGNSYEWRALTEFSYTWVDLRLALRWDYKSSIEQEQFATDPTTTVQGTGAYHLFDLLGSYNLTDDIWLRFGIENLFNEEPPIVGWDSDPPPGFLPGPGWPGAFNVQNYDINGRRFYVGARVNFD